MSEVNHLARNQDDSTDYSHANIEDGDSSDSDHEPNHDVKQVDGRIALQIEDGKPLKRHWGKNWTCLYIKGEPFLTLGPHCNPISCDSLILLNP